MAVYQPRCLNRCLHPSQHRLANFAKQNHNPKALPSDHTVTAETRHPIRNQLIVPSSHSDQTSPRDPPHSLANRDTTLVPKQAQHVKVGKRYKDRRPSRTKFPALGTQSLSASRALRCTGRQWLAAGARHGSEKAASLELGAAGDAIIRIRTCTEDRRLVKGA